MNNIFAADLEIWGQIFFFLDFVPRTCFILFPRRCDINPFGYISTVTFQTISVVLSLYSLNPLANRIRMRMACPSSSSIYLGLIFIPIVFSRPDLLLLSWLCLFLQLIFILATVMWN